MTIRVSLLGVIATLTTMTLVGLALYAKLTYVPRPGEGSPRGDSTAELAGDANTVDVEIDTPPPLARPAIVLDVYDASTLAHVLTSNVWLRETFASPLGQGFWGAWSSVLGTRGADFGGHFNGTLFEAAVQAVEGETSRVVWFADGTAARFPAFVIEKPTASARTLFRGVAVVAARQTFHLPSCPVTEGDEPESAEKTQNTPITDANRVDVVRWSISGMSMYVVEHNARIVVAGGADSALNAACTALPERSRTPKSAMALQLLTQNMQRENQVLPKLLGLGEVVRFDVAVEGDTLRPLGIAGSVETARLGNAALDASTLSLFSEDTPFVFAANVALPQNLDEASLSAFYADGKGGVRRQVVVAWRPRGSGPSEVTIAWSKADDEAQLKGLFGGAMYVESACNHLVIAQSRAALESTRHVCNGKQPSLAHLSKPTVDHMAREAAVNVSIQAGKLLGGLMLDAYRGTAKDTSIPPDLADAQKRLEQLPFLGFAGALSGQMLVGTGYRS